MHVSAARVFAAVLAQEQAHAMRAVARVARTGMTPVH
jgi:hypothetical protein